MGNMLVHVPAFENIQPLVCIVNKCTEKKYLSLSKGGNSFPPATVIVHKLVRYAFNKRGAYM